VILGDPGSGKSTFVNFVAWCLAGEIIQSPYATIERLTSALPDDEGNPNYIAKLAKTSPDRWREVALLAGPKSSSGGPFAVSARRRALPCVST